MTARENLLRVIRHDQPEWVPYGMESVVTLGAPVAERPRAAGPDAFGVQWALEAGTGVGTYPAPGGHPITDIAQWRTQLVVPDVERLDWASVARQAAALDRREALACGFVEMGLFERSYLLLGMEAALTAYLTDTLAMAELIGAIADYKIRLIERFHDAARLDIVWYGDDWGTQANLFLPPGVWRAVIKPHTRRVYECLKRHGILVNQHSCGRIDAVIDDVVEMGADLINPCQPCNDLAGWKRRHGDQLTFSGGIDSQFVLDRKGVTPAEVRGEVRRRIDELAPGGGYIAAPSHGVPYDPAIVEAMNDEIARYGRACYAARAA